MYNTTDLRAGSEGGGEIGQLCLVALPPYWTPDTDCGVMKG